MPHCLTINNDLDTPGFKAGKTGLADTLLVAVRIHREDYPERTRFAGVHINLHPQCSHAKGGDCPEELSSVLLASPGRPKFFHMRRITLKYRNGTTEAQFEARATDAGALDFARSFGPEDDTVVVGFHYLTMAETLVTELPKYTLLDLGAELGGITGLLFGTGFIELVHCFVLWVSRRMSLYRTMTGRTARSAVRSLGKSKPDTPLRGIQNRSGGGITDEEEVAPGRRGDDGSGLRRRISRSDDSEDESHLSWDQEPSSPLTGVGPSSGERHGWTALLCCCIRGR